MRANAFSAVVVSALVGSSTLAASPLPGLDTLYPSLDALYLDIHQNPELSLQEVNTAAKLAARLREIGLEVTENVGGHGIVGVLRNGDGPVVLLRTDMDALPMREDTGVPYASTATALNAAGETVPVMHACGHDIHMAAWVGAAAMLSSMKDKWHGTVVFVGQPAEEVVAGARAMIEDGLFTRFPKPDYCIGIHVTQVLPAGQIGIVSGPTFATSDSVDIIIHGIGGHGAAPHLTVDPIVIAARTVLALQTIVSREVDPFDTAVVTVGSMHAGTKRNIIPETAKLELTIRSYKPEVQEQVLRSIERIAKAEAAAAGAPTEPEVIIRTQEHADVVINHPELTARIMAALRRDLGEDSAVPTEPVMGSEDFGAFGNAAGVPAIQLRIGTVEPDTFAKARQDGTIRNLPGPHSPQYAPHPEPTIRGAVEAFTIAVLELLGNPTKAP